MEYPDSISGRRSLVQWLVSAFLGSQNSTLIGFLMMSDETVTISIPL